MEPRIQYAKTSDGVNIAYWTMGEGMPFVVILYVRRATSRRSGGFRSTERDMKRGRGIVS